MRILKVRAWVVASAVVVFGGCGGDEKTQAESSCLKLVDAFASAWQRCMIMSYDAAYDTWDEQLACSDTTEHDPAAVDACTVDLGALPCGALNTSPASCTNALNP